MASMFNQLTQLPGPKATGMDDRGRLTIGGQSASFEFKENARRLTNNALLTDYTRQGGTFSNGNPDNTELWNRSYKAVMRNLGNQETGYGMTGYGAFNQAVEKEELSRSYRERDEDRADVLAGRAWEREQRQRTRNNWALSDAMRSKFEGLTSAQNSLLNSPDKFRITGV